MEFLITLAYFLLCLFIINKWSFFNCEGLSKQYIKAAFSLKVVFGFLIWAIYTYYYHDRSVSDIFKYFDDATKLYELFKTQTFDFFRIVSGINSEASDLKPHLEKLSYWHKPFDYGIFNDNRTVIRFNAIVYLFSMGFYHVHTIIMCFLSFTGLIGIYKTFYPMMKNKSKELFFAVFLVPSVLFWGSGVLKEGLLLFGLGIMIYHINQLLNNKFNLFIFLGLFISIGILLITKIYVFLVTVPGIITLFWIKKSGNKNIGLKFLTTHLVMLLMTLSLGHFNQDYDVLRMLAYKQKDFINVAHDTKAGSYIELGRLTENISSFLINTPKALINTLFRPHILDSRSPIILLASLENLLFIGLIILSIFFFKWPKKDQLPWFYFSIYFTILLGLLIGLVVPVIGAIVRYKVPLLPFFVIIFLLLIDKEKLIEKFKILRFLK